MYRTKKFFVLSMELLLGVLFAAVALTLPLPGFFQISIAVLWIAAFASSTQDICADGIYLTALDKASQSRFAGVQSMFWVGGKILAGLVLAADDEWVHLPVVGPPESLPPEPLRWPMVRLAEWAFESSDKAAERGRKRPGLVASAVMALTDRYAQ